MSAAISLHPPAPFEWRVRPPGSKSLTNRALLLAAVASGDSELSGCLRAEDTDLMQTALGAFGIAIAQRSPTTLRVQGAGGPLPAVSPPPELFVGTAGTVARFLLAVLAASPGVALMDGSRRMRQRPMDQLVHALRSLGANIRDRGTPGALPLAVGPHPHGLTGGEVRLARPASSQFISGLVLAGALARASTRIILEAGTPARPFVDMTLAVLERFGGAARWVGDTLEVTPTPLRGQDFAVEPDATAATYPLAMAAIWKGSTTVLGLGRTSHQGDIGFAKVLEQMGARIECGDRSIQVTSSGTLRGVDVDLGDMPDTTLTLAVTAMFAHGPTRIRGVEILRHHESDRLAAAATELRKLGAEVDENPDGLHIVPPAGGPTRGITIETYNDHRMAMAFSLAGHVAIAGPDCVAKTYPEYWTELARLGMVQGMIEASR